MTREVSNVSKVLSKFESPRSTDSSARHPATARAAIRSPTLINFAISVFDYSAFKFWKVSSSPPTVVVKCPKRNETKTTCVCRLAISRRVQLSPCTAGRLAEWERSERNKF